ncbi:hypothetical protein PMAYCL1PPCAC_20271 [Pristionchus mayeri]|uniref:AMP-dependent synthetase/ligase domain-containing protein n=1 Tax=Pristionchus mayeri TaxID=1317129 RepID=A0AAN5CSM9_9BILA|nr:hypothetical protein PMAYCL1PPCAC_20271 [Pristionchus mayeri]
MIICVRYSDGLILPEGVIDFEETLLQDPMREIAPVTPESECLVVCLVYSSGTTGLPKGVRHTNRAFHCGLEMLRSHFLHEIYSVLGVDPVDWYEEAQVVALGFYHISGFLFLNWFLVTGSPIVLMKVFDGDVYLNAIGQFQPRFLLVSPPIFAYLAKDPAGKKCSLSSVEMIMCGAAPLSKELSDEFQANHPNVKYIVQSDRVIPYFFIINTVRGNVKANTAWAVSNG